MAIMCGLHPQDHGSIPCMTTTQSPWRLIIMRVRQLVRITDIRGNHFYVVVPGWSVSKYIKILFKDIPKNIAKIINVGTRLHAEVNLDAEHRQDLCFDKWEDE